MIHGSHDITHIELSVCGETSVELHVSSMYCVEGACGVPAIVARGEGALVVVQQWWHVEREPAEFQ